MNLKFIFIFILTFLLAWAGKLPDLTWGRKGKDFGLAGLVKAGLQIRETAGQEKEADIIHLTTFDEVHHR